MNPPVDHEDAVVFITESEMDTLYAELLLSNTCVFNITGSDVIPKTSAEAIQNHLSLRQVLFSYKLPKKLDCTKLLRLVFGRRTIDGIFQLRIV